jgi:hypothetical protein
MNTIDAATVLGWVKKLEMIEQRGVSIRQTSPVNSGTWDWAYFISVYAKEIRTQLLTHVVGPVGIEPVAEEMEGV